MTSIPASKTHISTYTPPSLENVVPKPVFRLRPATWDDKLRYQDALVESGVRIHDDDSVREETRKALRELWSEEQHKAQITRLEAFWADVDYAAKDSSFVINPAEIEAVSELVQTVLDLWPPLRRMNRDNVKFSREAPMIALGMFLAGWSNIDVPFKLEAGAISRETIYELAQAIAKMEEGAEADKVEGVMPGQAIWQLANHTLSHINLTKAEEKNSPAPSSRSSIRSGSKSARTARSKSGTTSSKKATTRKTGSAPATASS